MADRSTQGSIRKLTFYAVALVLAVAAVALGGPRLVAWLRHAEPPAPVAGFDRPPTDEELSAARVAERKLARAEGRWEGSTVIPPAEAVQGQDGERTRWFQGFGLSVESRPEGAEVLVGGEVKGRTPLVTSVDCEPGDEVIVEVRAPSLPARRHTTTCRKDRLVELSVDLR